MEKISTLRDWVEFAMEKPILGMEKYTLGQGLNEKQALEIKELIACSVGLNLNDIQLDSELPSWESPYWDFIKLYLSVIGVWGELEDNYYDRSRGKLWNALNIQEKLMADINMGVMARVDIYKYKWTQ